LKIKSKINKKIRKVSFFIKLFENSLLKKEIFIDKFDKNELTFAPFFVKNSFEKCFNYDLNKQNNDQQFNNTIELRLTFYDSFNVRSEKKILYLNKNRMNIIQYKTLKKWFFFLTKFIIKKKVSYSFLEINKISKMNVTVIINKVVNFVKEGYDMKNKMAKIFDLKIYLLLWLKLDFLVFFINKERFFFNLIAYIFYKKQIKYNQLKNLYFKKYLLFSFILLNPNTEKVLLMYKVRKLFNSEYEIDLVINLLTNESRIELLEVTGNTLSYVPYITPKKFIKMSNLYKNIKKSFFSQIKNAK
jgi:hypothetical protein